MHSHNLHHVKGSRTLDANSPHSSTSDNSLNGNKVTNLRQHNINGTKETVSHAHSHSHSSHHSHSHNDSTATNGSSSTKAPTKKSSSGSLEKGYATQHVKTNLSGTPIFSDSKKLEDRFIKSLRSHYHDGVPEPGRSNQWPYLGYMLNGFKNLFLTFYFNWTLIFTNPLSSILFIAVYPTTVIFLVLFEIGLKLFMEKWGGAKLVRYISLKHGQGFGAINWGSPELLLSETSAELVRSTLPSLGLPATTITVSGCRRRTFDLSIAQTFVLLSSLIYERDSEKVKQAYDLYSESRKTAEPLSEQDMVAVENKMKALLWDSEYRIRQIAESWGLHFAGVSELKSLGGPFCGIFWSETIPFIVVVFKGTTPTNYEEFLVDATFQRTDARSFLFGCVHEGFYESLFSTSGFGDQDIRDPYGSILAAVQSKAAQIQEQLNTTEPIQLYLGGHSLGASLSSLLFSRWLKCPSDLSRRLVLRDAYVIGTPAVGDNDFASTFSSHTNLPVTRSSTLWRIINKSDIFCRLPPGYDSKTCGHFMSESDFFNYSHVGHAIQITRKWHSKPLKSYPSSYQPPMQVDIVTHANHENSNIVYRQVQPTHGRSKSSPQQQEQMPILPNWANFFIKKPWLKRYLPHGNPIYFIEKLYPFFLMDHIPARYFEGLQRARTYYENEEMKQITESLGVLGRE